MVKLRTHINEAQKSLSYKRFGKELWELGKEEKIQFAIENCRRIRITYNDKKGGGGKNTRYLLPLVYGITKNGKKAIRAFQTFGSTKRGVPKYKLFLFDNVGQVDVGNVKYYNYEQELISTGFNTAGDKSFADIYSITPLARNFNPSNLSNQNRPIDQNPVKKTDIDKSEKPTVEPKEKPFVDKTQSKSNFMSNKKLDILPKNTIINNKIEAPDTEPVSKSEIETGDKNQSLQKAQLPVEMGDETKPVEKNDIEPEINMDNKLTQSYKDLMKRMENLYNDEEEENDEQNL